MHGETSPMRKSVVLALTLNLLAAAEPGPLKWNEWNPELFRRARQEKRFVLLEMEAVWCHWCHVMDQTTYRDPRVQERLAAHYLPVKVDQDSRPDLSNRYQDYGWPATIVFSPEGVEIVKLSGYVPPDRMLSILDGIVADPSPIVEAEAPPPPPRGLIQEDLRQELLERHFNHYDFDQGGYSYQHKFLNWNSAEFSLTLARGGDRRSARMARMALDGQLNLIDPVWGGVYQYSTHGDWKHPHFEKIMEHQAGNLRLFTLGALYFGDARYRRAADQIADYLLNFLHDPSGPFYTSQDADLVRGQHAQDYFSLDDAGRRARGMPVIDRHCYTRENGWAIESLALYAGAFQQLRAREAARQAAEWLVRERALPGGGFRHDASDAAGPFLGDSLAAGRAFLALYQLTGDSGWLERSREAASFIGQHFVHPSAGLATARLNSELDRLTYLRDENIDAARFFNLLSHYTGDAAHGKLRDQALAYLALPYIAREFNTGGVLLADWESRRAPIHFTLHQAEPLLSGVLQYPDFYRQVTREPGPRGVLVCLDERCSSPLTRAARLQAHLKQLLARAVR